MKQVNFGRTMITKQGKAMEITILLVGQQVAT